MKLALSFALAIIVTMATQAVRADGETGEVSMFSVPPEASTPAPDLYGPPAPTFLDKIENSVTSFFSDAQDFVVNAANKVGSFFGFTKDDGPTAVAKNESSDAPKSVEHAANKDPDNSNGLSSGFNFSSLGSMLSKLFGSGTSNAITTAPAEDAGNPSVAQILGTSNAKAQGQIIRGNGGAWVPANQADAYLASQKANAQSTANSDPSAANNQPQLTLFAHQVPASNTAAATLAQQQGLGAAGGSQ